MKCMFVSKVRPLLEYNCEIFSPYTIRDIDHIENVQVRFTRKVRGMRGLCYNDRLLLLQLESLELRRIKRDLIFTYKIVHGLVNIPFDIFFTWSYSSSTRGHAYKLYPLYSRTNRNLHFFHNRVVNPGMVYLTL